MKIKKHNLIILIALFVATVVTLGVTVSQRMKVEVASDTVEMIFDYAKLLEIEDYEKTTMGEWLKVATNDQEEKYSIALKEEYLLGFSKSSGIYYATVGATKNSLVAGLIDKKILELLGSYDDQAIIIKTTKASDKTFLENAFSFYEFLKVEQYQIGEDYYFLIDHGFNDSIQLDTLPIGFDPLKVKTIKDSGAQLCLRPLNYTHDATGAFNLFVSEAEKHQMDSKIVFFENEVIGYEKENPESVMLAANYLRDNNLNFQIVESAQLSENIKLEGYDELIKEIGYHQLIRMFNVWDFIATKYQYLNVYEGAEEIENTIFRAVSERNNRAVVLNIFRNSTNTKYITAPEEYSKMFASLETRLEKQGINFGSASPFEDYEVSRVMLYLMAIEVVLFIVILLNMTFGDLGLKINGTLAGIGVLGVIAMDILSRGLFINIIGLAAGIALSTIAVLYYIKYVLFYDEEVKGKSYGIMFINVINTILIAFIGGLFIASFRSRTEFLLVFETFKGVKLSLLTPIALLFVTIFVYFIKEAAKISKRSVKDELVTTTTSFLNINIKMYYVIIFGAVGFLGIIYILRTGNTGATPSTAEFLIRNFFENNLFARPRNKELFVAVPMMIVGLAFVKSPLVQKNIYTRFVYITAISLCVVIETTSIINTFSHRTPLDMSIYRTFAALIFGIVFGVVYTLIFKGLILVVKKINEKYKLVGY